MFSPSTIKMYDHQARLDSESSDSTDGGHSCPICKRTFAQESTRKRHYYYCRSKRPDTNTSRRRSCTACVRAKTRCIRPAEGDFDSCNRCNERGVECDLVAPTRRNGAPRKGSRPSPTTGSSLDETTSGSHGREISAISKRYGLTGSWQDRSFFSQGPTLADSPDELAGTIWGQSVSEMDRPVFENVYGGSQAIDIMDLFNSSSDVLTADPTSLTSWTLQLTGPALFDRRPFPRPKHGPLASLVMRMLRSYPFMMLRKAALPPFIHPLLFTWAEAGAGPSQEALINCVGLVDLFKSRKGSDRDVVWKLIKLEQERIVASHSEVDRWELLASFQALLVYCLLRLQEAPAGDHGFDSGLLTAVNVIFNALSASVGGILKMKLPDDPNVSWTDWIYNESRRRTVLVFQIINIMVEWSTAASAYATCGLVLIPLANNATLWNAKNSESWRSEFTLCCKERSLMGVSQSGALTKLLLGDSGITLSTVEWEEWTAEVGDIGTLVMMVGALL